MAWGVPDAVLLPDGRVRLYWVAESSGMRGEKIVSATSDTTDGTNFTQDSGYRLEILGLFINSNVSYFYKLNV
jgi:hypothetical protein